MLLAKAKNHNRGRPSQKQKPGHRSPTRLETDFYNNIIKRLKFGAQERQPRSDCFHAVETPSTANPICSTLGLNL